MSLSEKVFRLLLRAYPIKYRDLYAEPMEQLFRDRLRDSHSLADLTSLWLRTLADWIVSVPVQYFQGMRRRPQFASVEPARRCIFYACYEARTFSREEITLDHLLLGIVRQEPSLVTDAPALVRAIEIKEPARRRFVLSRKDLRLSRETARVWSAAAEMARAERRLVTPQDLVAGILSETDTPAAQLLRKHLPG